MKRKSRKRSRKAFEEAQKQTDEELIDDGLKEIYENDEVLEPTKKKVRLALQSKLNASKSYMKQHKHLIRTLIQRYWINPPKMSNNSNNKESQHTFALLALPDHIQLYVFAMLHPKSVYLSSPVVCKWWYHLLHKHTFLHSLCSNALQLHPQQIPNPLQLRNLISFLKQCCVKCSNHDTFDDIYGANEDNTQDIICWKFPICRTCFDIDSELQGLDWVNARRKYRLDDYDLFCSKYKKFGRTYVLHSDVIAIAKDKYGDISRIHTLSPLEIAAINSQRKRCYNKKYRELKQALTQWLLEEEMKRDENEDKEIDDWRRFKLDGSLLKSELTAFFVEHHHGYEFFGGAHCRLTVNNFDRNYMDLIQSMTEIKALLTEHMDKFRKRKYEIRNMSKSEIYSDIYASSWMDGRFGGGYGNYI